VGGQGVEHESIIGIGRMCEFDFDALLAGFRGCGCGGHSWSCFLCIRCSGAAPRVETGLSPSRRNHKREETLRWEPFTSGGSRFRVELRGASRIVKAIFAERSVAQRAAGREAKRRTGEREAGQRPGS